MKNCVQCGKSILDDAKFCTFCGAEQIAKAVECKCVRCGNAWEDGARFCSVCGAKREEVPQPKTEENKCVKCGRPMAEDSPFCPECGAKQAKVYTEVFERGGLSEKDFIDHINRWFQGHPKAANIHGRFEMDSSIGLLANKYSLNKFTIEYELFSGDNNYQYALVKEDVTNLSHHKTRDFVEQWKAQRPQVKVMNWEGGTHSRGHTSSFLLGGLGAANRMNVYILFKFLRKQG